MHPLQPDISSLSDKDLEEKIQELTKKYFQALRFSSSIANQIVLLLDGYKLEQQERILVKNKRSEEGNNLDDLINIE